MAKKKITKKKQRTLIKKGTPLASEPSFKLDSSHSTEKAAAKRAEKVAFAPKVSEVQIVAIPKQHAVFVKRSPRITPKRPRLRR